MTVWTVSSLDNREYEPADHTVVGSYTTRGRALDECVDYVMERLKLRHDLAWSMAHDENHPDAAKLFSESRRLGRHVVRRGCVGKLRAFLRDELGCSGCYYVYDGSDVWHFDVDENDVEGELWHTVTWGDSDCEDPEFTTPWPEAFTSEETAVKTFVDYAKGLMAGRGMKVPGDFHAAVRRQLVEDGKCQVDLDDGCCVSCVLYHGDAKNVKE